MRIEENVALAPYTTFKIGGLADYFCIVETKKDLEEALAFRKKKSLALYVIGGGSNILVADVGFRGLVIKLSLRGWIWRDIEHDSIEAVVASGENWDAFVAEAVSRGVYGVENLSGIPGSVGGTPIQNVGAYGMEVADVIVSVTACNIDTVIWHRFTNKECKFGYRDSFFKTPKGKKYIVTEVTFRLEKHGKLTTSYKDLAKYFSERGEAQTLASVRKAVLEIRGKKFPDLQKYGTAGSFFKNPMVEKRIVEKLKKQYPDMPSYDAPKNKIKIPAAWLIEHVGSFKGIKSGDVGSFQNQALVVVNYGAATAADVVQFGNKIIEDIFKKTGIHLEREVQCVGFVGDGK